MVRLLWPVAAVVVVAVVVLVVVGALLVRRQRPRGVVAHSAWVRDLPAVRAALRRAAVTRVLGVLGIVVALAGTAVLAGRPVDVQPATQLMGRRDIVLCLDVSGSMTPYDSQILGSFEKMVPQFDGERIALSVFNATSHTIFPLTDDYGMVLDELDQVKKDLNVDLSNIPYTQDLSQYLTPAQLQALADVWAGTLSWDGSSLVGDGLASCSLLFDSSTDDRSRSIVLATDNDVQGVPVYTLEQAAALAHRRQASLYGLFPQDKQGGYQDRQFSQALKGVGGKVWYAEDPQAVDGVVAQLVADQSKTVVADAPPQVTDRQRAWTGLAGLGVVLLLGARVWGRR